MVRRGVGQGASVADSCVALCLYILCARVRPPQLPDGHSHYGSRTLLKRYLAEPSLLLAPGAPLTAKTEAAG
jgi:hypothetical protein